MCLSSNLSLPLPILPGVSKDMARCGAKEADYNTCMYVYIKNEKTYQQQSHHLFFCAKSKFHFDKEY